jgi:hypothetical protein
VVLELKKQLAFAGCGPLESFPQQVVRFCLRCSCLSSVFL